MQSTDFFGDFLLRFIVFACCNLNEVVLEVSVLGLPTLCLNQKLLENDVPGVSGHVGRQYQLDSWGKLSVDNSTGGLLKKNHL